MIAEAEARRALTEAAEEAVAGDREAVGPR